MNKDKMVKCNGCYDMIEEKYAMYLSDVISTCDPEDTKPLCEACYEESLDYINSRERYPDDDDNFYPETFDPYEDY